MKFKRRTDGDFDIFICIQLTGTAEAKTVPLFYSFNISAGESITSEKSWDMLPRLEEIGKALLPFIFGLITSHRPENCTGWVRT
jgi:hypothetical protein